MDWGLFWTIIGAGCASIGIIYQFFRNFKGDVSVQFDRLEKRMDASDSRISSLEERMFFMATGKTLTEAILLEKIKRTEEGK